MPAPAAPIAKNVPATVGDDGQYVIGNAVRVMRAARSLRGAGEGNQEARKGEETGR